jgi:hypothetical protein
VVPLSLEKESMEKLLLSLSLEKKATERKFRRNRNVKDTSALGPKFRPYNHFSRGETFMRRAEFKVDSILSGSLSISALR